MFDSSWGCSVLACSFFRVWPETSKKSVPKLVQKSVKVVLVDKEPVAQPTLELERYLITEKDIGFGSTGLVHAGLDTVTGEKVAVKMMPITSTNCLSLMREKEINLLVCRSDHENIVQCRDVYQDGYKMTLVMELLPRGDLLDAISPNIGLPVIQAVTYAKQLLNALEFLHSKGVAHRDVKPENCLLSFDKTTLKLGDFGHAVQGTGALLLSENHGTLPYMSPETIARRVTDHAAADVWSAGCVLFAMVTGRFPWCLAGNSNREFLLYAQGKHSEKEGKCWNALPRPVHELLRHLLAIDPKDRPTAAEAVGLVDDVLSQLKCEADAKVMVQQLEDSMDLSEIKYEEASLVAVGC